MGSQKTTTQGGRLPALDVLRALAVALVIVRHQPLPTYFPALGFKYLYPLQRGGWTGVDLFFVLSGFLISGLLFREHRRYGSIHLGRFFVRRGLKIYPAFYLFLAATLPLQLHWNIHTADVMRGFWHETLFIQNYTNGLWEHTWTLAVEEHFYIALPVFLLILTLIFRKRENPFRVVPIVFGILALLLLWARREHRHSSYDLDYCSIHTHLRIDSLFFGVLLAYYFHYAHDAFIGACRRAWPLLMIGGVALLSPAFFIEREKSRFIYTTGFTLFYLGSGMLLAAAVSLPWRPGRIGRGIAYIGSHSYSIYLWHIIILKWVMEDLLLPRTEHWPWLGIVFVYYVLSIGAGILMSNVLEYPVLRLRDRLVPSRVSHVLAPAPVTSSGATAPQVAGAEEGGSSPGDLLSTPRELYI